MNDDRFVVVAFYDDDAPSVFGPFESRELASEWLAESKDEFAEIVVEITRLYSPNQPE
jgi:hypothetical protein